MGTQSIIKENYVSKGYLYNLQFNNYQDVLPYWTDLNQTYKSGELTLDWTSHILIWDHFHKPRGYQLQIIVTVEEGRCTGIFPFTRSDIDPFGTPHWSLSDDLIVAREFFSPPEKINQNISFLPPHLSDDLSCFYFPTNIEPFSHEPGGVIDLKKKSGRIFSIA